MKFWHVGLTVSDLDASIAQYEQLGLKLLDRFEKDQPHALAALMAGDSGTGIELWQWLDDKHPQVKYIKNHLAFLSEDPRDDVIELEARGCKVVIPETLGKLVEYTFLEDPSGAFIEIAKAKEGYGR